MTKIDDPVRIVHVDDDPDFVEVTTNFLEREHDRLIAEPATRAREVLDRLSEAEYDCIVSDYDMAEMNGIEFLVAVREDHPDLPFILFTGKESHEIASEAISAGVTDYVQKGSGSGQYELLAHRVRNAVGRTRAEQRVREQRRELEVQTELFNHAQNIADVGAWCYDVDIGDAVFSDKAAEIYGLSPDAEMTPERTIGFYHPEDRQRVREAFERSVADGVPYDLEARLLDDDGTQQWVHTHGDPKLEDGSVDRVYGVVQDVTERKQRERKLELIETLFEHAQECQFIVDVADGEFELRHSNDYYKRIVGLPPDEQVSGEMPTDLFGETGGREIIERYEECVATEAPVTYTVELPVPEEGTVYRTILAPVVTDDGVTHIVGTARDITDHRRREEELERQNERLEEVADLISHDLRNPLSVAHGRLELVRKNHDGEHLDAIGRALERMEALVEDFLTVAREGESVADANPVDLAAVVEECWATVETASASLEVRDSPNFSADASRLKQVFENLFRNSIEHGGEDVTITVGALDGGFYVEDDGPGIPDAETDDVFEAGYSTSPEGTGFGLSIVEQVVEAHGWDIHVADASGGGARFEVTGVEFVDE